MSTSIPSTVLKILLSFGPCFTAPTFLNFSALIVGWILCQGRHSISRVIQAAGGLTGGKDHSAMYRFFSRAKWAADAVGKVLFTLFLPFLGKEINAIVDDTLCRKGGPHFWGAGMHHDARDSTYGRFTSAARHVAFAFGHSWVILALWVPLPWGRDRGMAIPVLFRLYRSKKLSPESQYRKRTEFAAELIKILAEWIPEGRSLHLLGDSEYSSKTVVRDLPKSIDFTGSMPMNAALFARAPKYRGRGRPRKKGKRLPSPAKLAKSKAKSKKWQRTKVTIYGQEVELLVKTMVCLWYTVAGTRLVKVVVTRPIKGGLEDRAYFCTDVSLSAEEILVRYARRWSLEATFRNAKQMLRVEDPQNGWWRRKQRTRKPKKRPGPHARGNRGREAVEHTLPFAFVAYGIVVLWYLRHGVPEDDVARAKAEAPWYRHKRDPSFEDMVAALRRELWASRLSDAPIFQRAGAKITELRELLPRWLLAA